MALEARRDLEVPTRHPSSKALPSPPPAVDFSPQPGARARSQALPGSIKSPLFLRSGLSADALAQLDAGWCIADLEDSVPAPKKPAMRQWLRSLLESGCFHRRHLMVRVNGFDNSNH